MYMYLVQCERKEKLIINTHMDKQSVDFTRIHNSDMFNSIQAPFTILLNCIIENHENSINYLKIS